MEEKKIQIETDFIKLESLLKYAAVCSSGGEAKIRIQNEEVSVNGEICTQRGKKIHSGDCVELLGMKLLIE